MKLSVLNENKKPYRNRVEVFAVKNGKVYGGYYSDGSFGTFGGGTDGESIMDTAKREFEEESGYKITNVEKCDIGPVEVLWDGEAKSKKQKDRMEKYCGTRTWAVIGVLDDSGEKDKADGEDGQSGLSNVGLIDVDKAIESIENNTNEDTKKQQDFRIKVLRKIKNNI